MSQQLTRPLETQQIEAAKMLYARLEDWQRRNAILQDLKHTDPNFSDIKATLLKVAVINQFYYTNLWAVSTMAEHIVCLSHTDKLIQGSTDEIVKQIAQLSVPDDPEDPNQAEGEKRRKPREHTSFASKFAHFFIDENKFPIYDSYALDMVKFHLASKYEHGIAKTHPYRAFYHSLNIIRDSLPMRYNYKDIDNYLWLAGLCKVWIGRNETWADADTQWKENQDAQINREVKDLFNKVTPRELLIQLFPYTCNQARRGQHRWEALKQTQIASV